MQEGGRATDLPVQDVDRALLELDEVQVSVDLRLVKCVHFHLLMSLKLQVICYLLVFYYLVG